MTHTFEKNSISHHTQRTPMPSALWLFFTLACLVGLFDLSGHAFDLFHTAQALAATSPSHEEDAAKSKRSRTSPIRMAPTALGLTTIQNLRTASSPGMTRLVLDLDAKARPSKHPQLRAAGVAIEIPHTILSSSAKTKLAAGRVAKPFIITQSSDRSVEVTLPAGSFQSYKLLTLANPNRLVIDVVSPGEPPSAPLVQSTLSPELPLPTPPQPIQPRS